MKPGDCIGRYTLLHLLGEGGQASVFAARRSPDGALFAVKVEPRDKLDEPRWEQASRRLRSVDHPALVHLHDAGKQGPLVYTVMDLLDGETLQRRLARGAVPLADALLTGAQIACGLVTLHAAGFVHRDVKPNNIVLVASSEGERAVLLDFGSAKFRVEERQSVVGTNRPLTAGYAPPEALRDPMPHDGRCDVWSLGICLSFMIAGASPWGTLTDGERILAVLEGHPEPTVPPGLPSDVEELLRATMARALEERPPMVDVAVRLLGAARRLADRSHAAALARVAALCERARHERRVPAAPLSSPTAAGAGQPEGGIEDEPTVTITPTPAQPVEAGPPSAPRSIPRSSTLTTAAVGCTPPAPHRSWPLRVAYTLAAAAVIMTCATWVSLRARVRRPADGPLVPVSSTASAEADVDASRVPAASASIAPSAPASAEPTAPASSRPVPSPSTLVPPAPAPTAPSGAAPQAPGPSAPAASAPPERPRPRVPRRPPPPPPHPTAPGRLFGTEN
jgi:serine/threonine-protein kinase